MQGRGAPLALKSQVQACFVAGTFCLNNHGYCSSALRKSALCSPSMDRLDLSFLEPSTSLAGRHPELEQRPAAEGCMQRFPLPQVQDVRAPAVPHHILHTLYCLMRVGL